MKSRNKGTTRRPVGRPPKIATKQETSRLSVRPKAVKMKSQLKVKSQVLGKKLKQAGLKLANNISPITHDSSSGRRLRVPVKSNSSMTPKKSSQKSPNLSSRSAEDGKTNDSPVSPGSEV